MSDPIVERASPLPRVRSDDSAATLADSGTLAVVRRLKKLQITTLKAVTEGSMALRFSPAERLEQERLEAAKAKLTRDWDTTVANWYKLTKGEMSVLALDESATKKMRKFDGILHVFNLLCVYVQMRQRYQGYGPIDAALDNAESPLQFFFFMPPRLWLRIESESNKYYNQHLEVPPVLALDEAMIPSRSRHNVTRPFMKDKPHKWGTKLFMTYYSLLVMA
ncbi:hypothetical protein PHMEG_00013748 [Phytophthora megakarya]|uniref:PiggyBac transposable element-derived protein domain-containing protein n=1 Tax=Phytophthora megakarya TaxID=4795 RepID=A0A225W843_9STRA|nr:hypothetical protein PHMEG_00013748 [Phytophthora megakarya]